MSATVAPSGSSGQPVQLGLDPGAVVLVLIEKTEADLRAPAPAAGRPPASATASPRGGGNGQVLDRYA
jgi:hypothetical protein